MLSVGLLDAKPEVSERRGKASFAGLQKSFPQYFSLGDSDGNHHEITATSVIGKFVIEKLSTKTEFGWILWRGSDPVKKGAGAQCFFHQGRKWVEICFSDGYKSGEKSAEDFWTALVFELTNATHGMELRRIHESASELSVDSYVRQIVRLEYQSALMSQKFYTDVWRVFCEENGLEFRPCDWFFPVGTSFEQWYLELKGFAEGQEYLGYYKSCHAVELKRLSRERLEQKKPEEP